MRVAFAGTPQFALPALAALAAHHEVVGVLTRPDRRSGRGQKLTASPVKEAALAQHFPLAQPLTLRDAAAPALLAAWRPDALVVVAYGLILPPVILETPRYGCLNIHASLLPRWRGAAPIQRAILAGDTETGVSIMRMEEGLDSGPVLLARRIRISPQHTSGTLHAELAALGAAALLEALAGLAHGTLEPQPQSQAGITYAAKIHKAESRIDWGRAAAEIGRQVRAFNPWPVAETLLEGEPLRVLEAAALETDWNQPLSGGEKFETGVIVGVRDGIIMVACGEGCLGIRQVQRAGRRPVAAADFAHTRPLLGLRLG